MCCLTECSATRRSGKSTAFQMSAWRRRKHESRKPKSSMQKAKGLEAEIAESLEEMNGHSFTDEKEQLFHAVYSNAVSYFANAENVFQMSREGNSETARYYVTSYLADLYFCIVVVTVVCVMLCVGITSRLEKYKNQLEEENERKTQDLIRHNRKMLSIQENAIIGMADLIENRDQDTGEHVKRAYHGRRTHRGGGVERNRGERIYGRGRYF